MKDNLIKGAVASTFKLDRLDSDELAILGATKKQVIRDSFTVILDNTKGTEKRNFLIGGLPAIHNIASGGVSFDMAEPVRTDFTTDAEFNAAKDKWAKSNERIGMNFYLSTPTSTSLEGGPFAIPALLLTHDVLIKGFTYSVTKSKDQFYQRMSLVSTSPFKNTSSQDLSGEVSKAAARPYVNNPNVLELENYHFALTNTKALSLEVMAGEQVTLIFTATFIEK